MTDVRQTAIIRTRSGGWCKPAQALIVPPSLMFQDEPLFSQDELQVAMHQRFEYVHSEMQRDREILTALGCQNIDGDVVCSVISSSFSFSKRSYEWISHLFHYLHTNLNVSKYFRRYKAARFLRLATGTWTSVSGCNKVYLPLLTGREQTPMGIELPVLDSEFYQEVSKSRTANLFLTMNLKLDHLHDSDLITEIIRVHREGQRRDGEFNVETCLNHTQYLARYQHLMGPSEKQDIRSIFRVADHHNLVKPNKDVIVDWTFAGNGHIQKCTLSEICSSDRFSFLSRQYSQVLCNFLECFTDVQFIASFTQAATTRYSSRTELPSSFYLDLLSPKRLGNNLLLYYLANNGISYRSSSGKDVLLTALRKLEFLCENGSFSALESCYLRTTHLEKFLTDNMGILHLESPNDHKWSFLKGIGVTSEPNLELFLHQLREQKRTASLPLSDQEGIEGLYKELAVFSMGSRDRGVRE